MRLSLNSGCQTTYRIDKAKEQQEVAYGNHKIITNFSGDSARSVSKQKLVIEINKSMRLCRAR
jgi:hypothetical protein